MLAEEDSPPAWPGGGAPEWERREYLCALLAWLRAEAACPGCSEPDRPRLFPVDVLDAHGLCPQCHYEARYRSGKSLQAAGTRRRPGFRESAGDRPRFEPSLA